MDLTPSEQIRVEALQIAVSLCKSGELDITRITDFAKQFENYITRGAR